VGPADARRVDLGGRSITPGFLDLHFHGGLVFCPASGMAAAIEAASAALVRNGTTAFLPTSVAWPAAELGERVSGLAAAISAGGFSGAAPLGLHLEGPWINPAAAGAQPEDGIRPFDAREGADVLARGEGAIRMVTFAPEVQGADDLLVALLQRDVVGALGHSHASAAQAEAAVVRGARHVTHLFNAMGAVHHREPGLAGFALGEERLTCDLICDGAHVHPAMVRVAARAKGDRLVLITDRIDPPDGSAASFGSGDVTSEGDAYRLGDGRLAGSRVTLDRAVRNARAFAGLSALAAVACATLHPARVLGIENERGTLRTGARADLAVLDASGEVAQTWVGGRCIYESA
jgi:N-acetylglucosamine-6-phosphate deacetylase